jgi:SpoVK/Ycf46/Vps4 family AAA+-type ATPase
MPNDNENHEWPEEEIFGELEDHRTPRPRRRSAQREQAQVGLLVQPEERHALEQLVLPRRVTEEIAAALRSISLREQMEAVWKWSQIRPHGNRCVLNFYGPPGTGKSRAALGIAWQMNKALYQVDYSAIVSKYLGDTAKHIVAAFRQAKDADAILFFDEADSLLSRRVQMGESCATSINQNRNVLMQELDRFDGVVIMTTNLFGNYDEAILRRVARHVEFRLPGPKMRQRLFEMHLPNPERVTANLQAIAEAAEGLSGGDILNVCVNAMEAASTHPDPANWRVNDALLRDQVEKVKKAKLAHAGRAPFGLLHPTTN